MELFYWAVRFFKNQQKEEFVVYLSSRTGEVVDFTHTINETERRETFTETEAKERAIAFLKTEFNFKEDRFTLDKKFSDSKQNRTDFSFIWKKKFRGHSLGQRFKLGNCQIADERHHFRQ